MMVFVRWMRLPGVLPLAVLLACGIGLAGCGSEADNKALFRIIQASPDLAPVNFLVNGVVLRASIDYKGGTGFLSVTPKTYTFGLDAILLGADGLAFTRPVFSPVAQAVAIGREYTLITVGKDSGGLLPLVVENPIEDVPLGNARLQFVHAAPDVPPLVDIYLTAVPVLPAVLPDLSTQVPIAQVTYAAQPAPRQLVQTGTYVIRVTLPGSTIPVFQSIEFGLTQGNDLLIVAVDNSATGAAPISLVVGSGFRGFFNPVGTADLLDKDTPSDLRVVQVSPDAPVMNILGTRPQEAGTPTPPLREVTFATGLNYLDATGYVPTTPDAYSLRGVDPTAATPLLFTVFPNPAPLALGQRNTLFVIGLLQPAPPATPTIDPLVLSDEIRPVFAAGKLRVVDASPASGIVDVYILPAGTLITNVAPTVSNLGSRGSIPHLPFVPGNYTVTFTAAGTKTPPLAFADIAATAGTVQTVVLVDAPRPTPGSDGKPATVLVLNDLEG